MTAYKQIKKHEEYKELCMASKKKPTAPVPEGYNLWDTVEDDNGFFACVYQKGDEMIIVYRSSGDNKSGCTGSYPVSSYTRSDGVKVDSYIRTCYKHEYQIRRPKLCTKSST